MLFTVKWVDVSSFLVSGEVPVYMYERQASQAPSKPWAGQTELGHSGEFWVPQGSVLDECRWAATRSGAVVRIPVFALRTAARASSLVFGLGMQIGMMARDALGKLTSDVPMEAILVLGNTVDDMGVSGVDAFRAYAGIAFRTK